VRVLVGIGEWEIERLEQGTEECIQEKNVEIVVKIVKARSKPRIQSRHGKKLRRTAIGTTAAVMVASKRRLRGGLGRRPSGRLSGRPQTRF
jgi:hypothetical protein